MADGSVTIDTKIDRSNIKPGLSSMKSDITAGLQNITNIMQSQLDIMQNKIESGTNNTAGKLRDIFQGVVPAVSMVGGAIQRMGGFFIGNASKIEDFTAAFTPLTGSTENAKSMIAALNREAATTPFELTEIAETAKQLLPILGNDTAKVTETFRMLGDTAGGNAQKLGSIARGYSKAMMKGKVDMEAINMIADAGVPIQSQLAESMGITVDEMMDLSSKGKITSADLTAAFKKMTSEGGIFFNGMSIASETLTGRVSGLTDNFKNIGAAIGSELLPTVKSIIDLAIKASGGFLEWLQAGDNLSKMLEVASLALAGFVAGFAAYQLIFNGAAALQGVAVAIKAITAAMASNPIGVIAVVITAVLIPAIIYMVRHWNEVVIIFQSTIAKIGMNFKIFGSILKESFVTAVNVVKIAFLELASIIINKVLGGISKLLKVASGIPGIGDYFGMVSGIVDDLNSSIQDNIDATEESSAKAIIAAKNEQDAIESMCANNIANINKEAKARIDALKKIKQETPTGGTTLPTPKIIPGGSGKAAGEQVAKNFTGGYTGKIKAVKNILRSAGIDVLKKNSKAYRKIGEMYGKEVADGYIKEQNEGLEDDKESAYDKVKKIFKNIGAGIKGFISTMQKIGSAIVSIANFDPQKLYDDFKGVLDGLADFLLKDIGKMSLMIPAAEKMITDFLDTIVENLPSIIKSIKNLVKTIVDTIKNNKDKWLTAINEIVVALSEVIMEELPNIIELFVELIISIAQTITAGTEKLIPAIVNLIVSIINISINMLPQLVQLFIGALDVIIKLVIALIPAIVDALVENFPMILEAIMSLILGLITMILENLPAIIESFMAMIPMLIESILTSIPQVITAIITLIIGIISAIIENLPAIIASFISMIPVLIAKFIEMIPTLVLAFIKMIVSIAAAVIEQLPVLIEAFIMFFPQVIKGIWDNRQKIADSFVKIGQNTMNGFISGIVDFGRRIWDRVKKAFEDFGNKVKNFFGIHSPSKVFAEMGGFLVQGMENGIIEDGKGMFSTVKGTFQSFNNSVDKMMTGDKTIGIGADVSAYNSVLNGIKAGGLGVSANITSMKSNQINVSNNISGVVEVDGRTLGRIVFDNLDTVTRGAYGI